MDSILQVPSINGETSITYTGNGNLSTSAKSSGGSTSKPAAASKKSFTDRYETSEKAIKKADEDKSDWERIRNASYGKDNVEYLNNINWALNDKQNAVSRKKAAADAYLPNDKLALQNAFRSLTGTNINIDSTTGQVLTDMEAVINAKELAYNNAVNTYNAELENAWSDGIITAAEKKSLDSKKEALDEQEKKINEVKDAY
jgi:hypothetical protein